MLHEVFIMLDIFLDSSTNKKIKNLKIAVVGDFCLDEYLYIDHKLDTYADYAELDIYQVPKKDIYPGGAGNIVKNLLKLGVSVYCFGFIGEDGTGYDTKNYLKSMGANVNGLYEIDGMITNKYIRTISNKYTINELLICENKNIESSAINTIYTYLNKIINEIDGIILLEQFDKDDFIIINDYFRELIIELSYKHADKIFLADSKNNIDKYENIYIKCNKYEFKNTLRKNDLELKIGENIFEYMRIYASKNKGFFLTVGGDGVIVQSDNINLLNVKYKSLSNEIIDTCGAGDSATVGIIIGLCLKLDMCQSAMLGNIIAFLTIQQIGKTGEVNLYELLKEIKILNGTDQNNKISTLDNTSSVINRLKTQNKRIVMCCGCFDILHIGHLEYLSESKQQGDILIVAVNSDLSYKNIKNKSPVFPVNVRMSLLSGLECVDYIFSFDDDNCSSIIDSLNIDLFCVGIDKANIPMKEQLACERRNIEFKYIGSKKIYSSNEIKHILNL